MVPTNATVTAGKLQLTQGVVASGTSTEPNLWKLDTYTGTAPNYSTVDSVSALNMSYSTGAGTNESWVGQWFEDPANLTSKLNNGSGTSGTFTTPTLPSGGALAIPSGVSASQRYVNAVDLNLGTGNDGYGEFTVEARVKNDNAGTQTAFNVFWVGDDYGTNGGGYRIQVYVDNKLNISTESAGGSGFGNKDVTIPFTAISAAFTAAGVTYTGDPTNGAYHKYRLARKRYTTVTGPGATVSDPRLLFQLWYDDVEIPLQIGLNGVAFNATDVRNVTITAASAYIRVGSTSRQTTTQAITMDYVRFKNSITYVAPTVTSVPNHVSGYFETRYGTTNYTVSNYSTTGITRGSAVTGAGVLVTGVVKPLTNFSTATGGSIGTNAGDPMTAPFTCGVATSVNSIKDMVELLTIGDPTTPAAYVSVWVWRGGRILMFNGTSYTETLNPAVGSTEFVLGVHLTTTEPQLYINGVLKTGATVMLPWRSISGNTTTTVNATNTGALLSSTSTARGVYLGPRRTYDAAGVAISAAYKNWRLVDTALNSMTAQQIADTQLYRYSSEYDSGPLTVTYGFRIADDETLQIVKTQGSMASTTNSMLGNILPVSEDGTGALTVNSLGAIGSSTVDPVMDLTNKR
eukprot:jgi/Mesvir1/4614/Mv19621-RA.1